MRTTCTLCLLLTVTAAPAADWPQWRGPGRDGVWREPGLPDKLPTVLKPRWRRPIGGGYGGIAIAGGKVYVLDRQTQPREVERVLCLDAATGEQVWAHEYPVTYGKMDYGNGPRSTPTVHAGKVYTLGAVGHVHCLDATSGEVVWARDGARDFKARIPMWGLACSPLIDEGRVLVQLGGEANACLVALDRGSGKEVWRSLPDRPGYSSPVLIEAKGYSQLVFWTPEHVNGLDRKTGAVLWQVPYVTEYDVTITDPVWHHSVLLVADYWKGCKAIRLDEHGRSPRVIWSGRDLYMLMATPLCRGGYVYALDKRDGLKCIELATGQVKWENVHVTPKGRNPHVTMVWAGDRVVMLNELAELIVGRLTPAGFEQIGKARILKDGTWAHPAYAGRCVFARNDREIVCVPLAD